MIPLTLATTQLDTPFTHDGVVFFREGINEIVCIGLAGSFHYFLVRGIGLAIGDILANGSSEKHHVLGNESHLRPQL